MIRILFSIIHCIAHWFGFFPCRLVRHQHPGEHEWLHLECIVCGKTEEYVHSAVCQVCENMGTIQYEQCKTCGHPHMECTCPMVPSENNP